MYLSNIIRYYKTYKNQSSPCYRYGTYKSPHILLGERRRNCFWIHYSVNSEKCTDYTKPANRITYIGVLDIHRDWSGNWARRLIRYKWYAWICVGVTCFITLLLQTSLLIFLSHNLPPNIPSNLTTWMCPPPS